MINKHYEPWDGIYDAMGEAHTQWMARRIEKLETKIQTLEKHLQEDKNVFGRCRNRCTRPVDTLYTSLK